MPIEGAGLVVKLLEPDEVPTLIDLDTPPAKGWTVVAFAKVYKDRVPAGVFVELTIRRDGSSVLTYEEIRRFPT